MDPILESEGLAVQRILSGLHKTPHPTAPLKVFPGQIVTLATSAITVLAPYVKGAGDELLKSVGQIGLDKAKTLLGWLKKRFDDDPVAANDLTRFQTDAKTFEAGLKATIVKKLEDPDFAAGLEKQLAELGPFITVFQQIKEGKDVTGVDADV